MFGDKLRECRIAKDYDQERLAELVGVTDGTISNWETGSCVPSIKNAMSLCSVLPELKDDLLAFVQEQELVKVKQELEDVKAERDVWRKTTFDLLKEKQQWQQSSGV